MEAMRDMQVPGIDFTIPIVFVPHGTVKTLSRQDLLNLLEQIDQEVAPAPSYAEQAVAPL